MRLVSFVGFQGSGKDTAARYLIEHRGYRPHSFAESLKDAVASFFVWPRALLEGNTAESRAWRETVDPWWSDKLGIPDFTPRFALQYVGTEVLRAHFHKDIWIFNIERKLRDYGDTDRIVIIDCRFPNELQLARRHGGKVLRVRRGRDPDWYRTALKANFGDPKAMETMTNSGVHLSEWAWIGHPVDDTIENEGTLDELYRRVARHAS